MQSVACKNDNSALLHFLIISPDSCFYHNSATVRNILMVLGRIIEQVNADCRCKYDSSAYLGFLITSPYPYF